MIREAIDTSKNSLTVIVPCYNEEGNVRNAMQNLWESLQNIVEDFEIILINDASTDNTPRIINELVKTYPKTRAIHLPRNRGMGYAFFYGVAQGTKKYVTVFVGDNEIDKSSFRNLISHISTADILMAYHCNPEIRPLHRQVLSRLFTALVHFASGTSLRYYNGPAVHLRDAVMNLGIQNDGFGFLAEVTTALLQKGQTYKEIPIALRPRQFGLSQALQWKSIKSVLYTLGRMALQKYGKSLNYATH